MTRWIDAGLPIEHTRRLLGIDSRDAILPYATHRVEARAAAAITAIR